MPAIRAYTFEDRIIVKYYDNGEGEHLECPHCSWSGTVNAKSGEPCELFCPECDTMLASQSFVNASELVKDSEFESDF